MHEKVSILRLTGYEPVALPLSYSAPYFINRINKYKYEAV